METIMGYIGYILGYIGIMEKKMETTIMGYIEYIGVISGVWKSKWKLLQWDIHVVT